MLVSEVVRGKALALVLEKADVTDESGRAVDLDALREDAPGDELLDVSDDGIDHTGHDHD
jgi:trigger factor